ncbi:MAG TPA: hypothetical protein VKZ84_06620 [Bacteriovoracaceae bacterium]|nr:hypothetical protein [Bacteriovoracaceae bacterium]
MKTRVLTVLPLLFTLVACNQEDYYEKEFLENPFQSETPGGSNGGDQDGSTTGGDDGDTGGSSGDGSTGGSDGGGTSGGEVEGTAHTETFNQSETNSKKLDILWVIDDSGSMADEQAALGYNFSSFITSFIQKDVDFKMAITTTDTSSYKRGQAVSGSMEKLTSAKAQENEVRFLSDFEDLVKVGTRGSGREKGLDASKGFMERYASTFLRSDAYLAVVFMSDEEDQSEGEAKHYVDFLKSHKVDAGLVKVYSIVNTNTNYQSGLTVGYERYEAATNLTGGKLADINGNFHEILSEMGGNLLSLLDSFALAHTPLNGTLKVFVNNVQVSNFSYDAGSRSIKFPSDDLPPVGAEIRVEYKY